MFKAIQNAFSSSRPEYRRLPDDVSTQGTPTGPIGRSGKSKAEYKAEFKELAAAANKRELCNELLLKISTARLDIGEPHAFKTAKSSAKASLKEINDRTNHVAYVYQTVYQNSVYADQVRREEGIGPRQIPNVFKATLQELKAESKRLEFAFNQIRPAGPLTGY